MTKEDMILLIKVSDDLCRMDQSLEKLTSLAVEKRADLLLYGREKR